MKTCFKCDELKPLSEFYKHSGMTDGHLNKCKACAKKDVKENRDKRHEQYKEYDAWRFQNDPRVKERHKRYRLTSSCKESMSASRDKWARNNPEKRAAHTILRNAVRSGRVSKPTCCESCGGSFRSRYIHAHHEDYTRPIDVKWLCAACHVKEHRDKF